MRVEWTNINDASCGFIAFSISSDFKFHIQGIDNLTSQMKLGKRWKMCLVNTTKLEPANLKIN